VVSTKRKGFAQHLDPPTKRELATRNAVASAPLAGRCFAYVRVSTVRQAAEGESLEVQQRVLEGYALRHGLTIACTFIERGISGSRPLQDRPEGGKLIAELRAGDVLIAPKLDRLFRSALDAMQIVTLLRERKVTVHLCDLGGDINNGLGKTFFIIASAFAEAERDRTKERITEVKADQRRRGRHLGGALPFGYTKNADGMLVAIPEKRAIIGKMVRWRDQGLSLRKILARVTESGERISLVALDRAIKRERERRGAA
jgi:DNA invertase Pin-like site-specific DNA recombinase